MSSKVIACITTRDGRPDWTVYKRLAAACEYAAKRGVEVITCIAADNYGVAIARNRGVSQFIKDPDATHLFFLDNDVHIQNDTFTALLGLDADVAVGCYPSLKSPQNNSNMQKPYITVKRDGMWVLRWFDGALEVEAAGTGCMLIRRNVLETLGYPWFVWREWLDENGDIDRKSDDVDFCERIRELGFHVIAHGNVRCGHMKMADVAGFMYEDRDLDVEWGGPTSVHRQECWSDYGSHVPALQSVLSAYPIRRVVEYGCGRSSTPAILASDIISLVSYESNLAWLQDAQRRNVDDRLTMELCPVVQMADHIHPDADMVLIDCDTIKDGRENAFTGRTALISAYEATDAIVVIHDYNFDDIKPFVDASSYTFRTVYTPDFGPQTAVLSNKCDVRGMEWIESKRKTINAEPIGATT